MGQYHDLYLTTDMLLLADYFERIRETAYENYEIGLHTFYNTSIILMESNAKNDENKSNCIFRSGHVFKVLGGIKCY